MQALEAQTEVDVHELYRLPVLPPFTPDEGRWRAKAACQGLGADYMMVTTPTMKRRAKAICATCPVVNECRAFSDRLEATFTNEDRGGQPIWAGETFTERLRRRGVPGRNRRG